MRSRRRRGNFAVLQAAALVAVLGFGALAIDTSYMRLSHAQAQDVADAASQAALIALRATGNTTQAYDAAEAVVAANRVAGEVPKLSSLEFGAWDDTDPSPAFTSTSFAPNAVKAIVNRDTINGNPVTAMLSRIWGIDDFDVNAKAISATRSFQIIIVLDITNSWSEANFLNARTAVLGALEMLGDSASGVDEVGLTVFTNQYAWEYSSLTQVAVPANYAVIEDEWARLNTASKAGKDTNHSDGVNCTLNGGALQNNFTTPVVGGCYPDMPREYRDEPGTDHSVGMLLARQMFEDAAAGASYRAMIVVTDGKPNGLPATGTARAADGYTETRWNEYMGPAPRTANEIRFASIDVAETMWDELAVNTWVVSFVANDWMLPAMAQGDGYAVRTSNSAELSDLLTQIITELPLAIVD